MSVRIAMIEALRAAHGFDPEYDDGVDADTILSALHAAGFVVVPAPLPETDENKPGLWLSYETFGEVDECRAMIAAAKEAGV